MTGRSCRCWKDVLTSRSSGKYIVLEKSHWPTEVAKKNCYQCQESDGPSGHWDTSVSTLSTRTTIFTLVLHDWVFVSCRLQTLRELYLRCNEVHMSMCGEVQNQFKEQSHLALVTHIPCDPNHVPIPPPPYPRSGAAISVMLEVVLCPS